MMPFTPEAVLILKNFLSYNAQLSHILQHGSSYGICLRKIQLLTDCFFYQCFFKYYRVILRLFYILNLFRIQNLFCSLFRILSPFWSLFRFFILSFRCCLQYFCCILICRSYSFIFGRCHTRKKKRQYIAGCYQSDCYTSFFP